MKVYVVDFADEIHSSFKFGSRGFYNVTQVLF